MFKDEILAILLGYKTLAEMDFAALTDDERKEKEEYIKGYIEGIEYIERGFKKNL